MGGGAATEELPADERKRQTLITLLPDRKVGGHTLWEAAVPLTGPWAGALRDGLRH